MRLFEAVLEANRRALAGDRTAGVHVADYVDELPIVALTCVDPRLNRLLPGVLGLPEDKFIWLRNAGNIITGPLSSTMRSLALACAIKGGREIAVIGHTDCHVRQTTAADLLEKLKALGIDRHKLPDNVTEYFGLFAGERQNVIRGVDIVRSSPLIGPKTIVQGLLVNTQTGSLEWIVNGYDAPPQTVLTPSGLQFPSLDWAVGSSAANKAFEMGEMKLQDLKIGETAGKLTESLASAKGPLSVGAPATPPPPPPPPLLGARVRSIPLPPPIRMNPKKRP
jgi:carbonic anhydrase